jgi:hypothetical protein
VGDDELSRDLWIDRFALRLAMLDDMQHPLELLLQMGNDLWPTYGGVNPRSSQTLNTGRVFGGNAVILVAAWIVSTPRGSSQI